MSDQSRVFIGLLRPPKLMGLPIMYATVSYTHLTLPTKRIV